MVVTILGNTNTLPEKYRIAQYADPPYQLQPLVCAADKESDCAGGAHTALGNRYGCGKPAADARTKD